MTGMKIVLFLICVHGLQRTPAIVPWVMFQFGHPKCLQQWRQVHPKAAAQSLFKTVPTLYGVVGRTPPCLYRPLGGGLLLVSAAQRYPIAVLLEHGMQVFDAAQVITKLGFAYHADQ